VLHDLNHACRYATHLIAMRDGQIVAEGDPSAIVDAAMVERVFGLRCRVIPDPETGTPLVVPAASQRRAREAAPTADAASVAAG
jgi:iron complex transport system ATP-binding protein